MNQTDRLAAAPSAAGRRRSRTALWVWSSAIAIDLFLLSNPVALMPFVVSLVLAAAVPLLALVITSATPRRFAWTPELLAGLAFAAFAWLTISWSVRSWLSFEALGKFALVVLIAALTASCAPAGAWWRGGILAAAAILASSAFTALINVPRTRSRYGNAWLDGIGTSANILSYCMVLGVAACLIALPRRSITVYLALVAFLVCLFGASSRTGIAVVPVLAVVWALCLAVERARESLARLAKVAVGVLLVGSVVIAALLPWLLRWFTNGRADLGGRLRLWEAIVRVADQRPLGGFGWAAVWPHAWETRLPVVKSLNTLRQVQWSAKANVIHGHSWAFDLVLHVGWIGVALFAAVLIAASLAAVRLLRRGADEAHHLRARLAVLTLAAVLFQSLTEPLAIAPMGLFLLAGVICLTSIWRREEQEAGVGRHHRSESADPPTLVNGPTPA